MKTRVLFADDEQDIVDPVRYTLEAEGFEVDTVRDGAAALEAARANGYDVVVLDVMMPGLQGTEVCRQLRAESIVPIIMLSAKDAEVDRVLGLELGADDYVTKPFSARELASRIRAVLRRQELERDSAGEPSGQIVIADLGIDLLAHRVTIGGTDIRLTPSEFKVLALFAGRAGTRVQQVADHGASVGGVVRRHRSCRRRPHLESPAQDRGRPVSSRANRDRP